MSAHSAHTPDPLHRAGVTAARHPCDGDWEAPWAANGCEDGNIQRVKNKSWPKILTRMENEIDGQRRI